jgi:hypothetical protein
MNMDDDAIVEAAVEEAVEDPIPEDTAAEQPEEGAGGEESKTLLSGDEGEGDGEDTSVIPEEYTFSPPEGVEVDVGKLEGFSDTAKDLQLTQNQYQRLVEFDIERSAAAVQEMSGQFQERISSWADEAKADKELGGEDLDKNLGLAKQAMIDAPSADNPDGLGLGNHPEVIRLFYRVGRAISESDLVTGDNKIEGRDSLEKMYPTMFAAN